MVEFFEDIVIIFEEVIYLIKYVDKVRFCYSWFLCWIREEFVKFGKIIIKRVIEFIKIVFFDYMVDVDIILLVGVLF